jgi:hypothetical protein
LDENLGAINVSNIDKQRVAAVRKLEVLGYSFRDGEWVPATTMPTAASAQPLLTAETDAMHSALVQRADVLEGCLEGSEEERELAAITVAIEAEAVRWPEGKEPGGKG